jgi:hypothetical protein
MWAFEALHFHIRKSEGLRISVGNLKYQQIKAKGPSNYRKTSGKEIKVPMRWQKAHATSPRFSANIQ